MNERIEKLITNLLATDEGYETDEGFVTSNLSTIIDRLKDVDIQHIGQRPTVDVSQFSPDTVVLFRRDDPVEDYVLFLTAGVMLIKLVFCGETGRINTAYNSITPYEIDRDWLHKSGCILNGVEGEDFTVEMPFDVTLHLDGIIPGETAHWEQLPTKRGEATWDATYTTDDGHRVISVTHAVPEGWELEEPKPIQLAVLISAPAGINRTFVARSIGKALATYGYDVCLDYVPDRDHNANFAFTPAEVMPKTLDTHITEHAVNSPVKLDPDQPLSDPRVFPPVRKSHRLVNIGVLGKVRTGKSVVMTLIEVLMTAGGSTVMQFPLGHDLTISAELAVQLAVDLAPRTRVTLFTQPVNNTESIVETLRHVDQVQSNSTPFGGF